MAINGSMHYPMFSDTLCFRKPPIFHRNNYFLASENMFFCQTFKRPHFITHFITVHVYNYCNYPMFSDTLCFRTPPIFSPNHYFLASENMFFCQTFKRPHFITHFITVHVYNYCNYPMFSDTLCFRTPPIFSPNHYFLASGNMFFCQTFKRPHFITHLITVHVYNYRNYPMF